MPLPFKDLFLLTLTVLGALAILFFRIWMKVWFAKRAWKFGTMAASSQRMEQERYQPDVLIARMRNPMRPILYSLVGGGLVLAWYYTHAMGALLFGIAFALSGIVSGSLASMSDAELRMLIEQKKKRNILLARLFIQGSIAFIGISYFIPKSFLEYVDFWGIMGMLVLAIAIAGVVDHGITRMRIVSDRQRLL